MEVQWAPRQELGPCRRQEDFYLVHECERAIIFVLADGMGGLKDGHRASRIVCEAVRDHLAQTFSTQMNMCLIQSEDAVKRAVEHANRVLYRMNHGEGREGKARMGSTCVALVMTPYFGVVAHVGDSRAYLICRHWMSQLTVDHTSSGDELRRDMDAYRNGELTLSEVPPIVNPSGALTRAMGICESVEVDTNLVQVRPGDTFILCSDGLSEVDPREMETRFRNAVDGGASLRGLADMLMCMAQDEGVFEVDNLVDNATVVLVRLIEH